MLKDASPQQYHFETITLDELVPEDHLVRQIDAASILNLSAMPSLTSIVLTMAVRPSTLSA